MSTNANSLSLAEIERRCHAQKLDQSRWYYLHRRFSTPITIVCFRLGVSPNAISASMLFIGLLGNLALVPLNLPLNLTGLLLIYLAFLFDKVDGDLARLQGRSSPRAMILDYAYHRLTLFTFFGAVGGHAYLLTGDVTPLIAGFMTGFLANYAADAGAYPFRIYTQKVLSDGEPWSLAGASEERRFARRQTWWKALKIFTSQLLMVFAVGLLLCAAPQWLTPFLLVGGGCLLAYIAIQHYVYFQGGMEAELAFFDQCLRRKTGCLDVDPTNGVPASDVSVADVSAVAPSDREQLQASR